MVTYQRSILSVSDFNLTFPFISWFHCTCTFIKGIFLKNDIINTTARKSFNCHFCLGTKANNFHVFHCRHDRKWCRMFVRLRRQLAILSTARNSVFRKTFFECRFLYIHSIKSSTAKLSLRMSKYYRLQMSTMKTTSHADVYTFAPLLGLGIKLFNSTNTVSYQVFARCVHNLRSRFWTWKKLFATKSRKTDVEQDWKRKFEKWLLP